MRNVCSGVPTRTMNVDQLPSTPSNHCKGAKENGGGSAPRELFAIFGQLKRLLFCEGQRIATLEETVFEFKIRRKVSQRGQMLTIPVRTVYPRSQNSGSWCKRPYARKSNFKPNSRAVIGQCRCTSPKAAKRTSHTRQK